MVRVSTVLVAPTVQEVLQRQSVRRVKRLFAQPGGGGGDSNSGESPAEETGVTTVAGDPETLVCRQPLSNIHPSHGNVELSQAGGVGRVHMCVLRCDGGVVNERRTFIIPCAAYSLRKGVGFMDPTLSATAALLRTCQDSL